MGITNKIKIRLDEPTHSLLIWALAGLRSVGGIVPCLEVECLVLIEFERKNAERLLLTRPPFNVSLRPHEALSLRRLLIGIDLQDPMGNIARNHICDAVQRELPGLC